MTTLPEPFVGHEGAVRAIAVFADGQRAVTGGDDAKIRVWELRSGRLLDWHAEHEDQVLAVATTAHDRIVSCGRTKIVRWKGAGFEVSGEPYRTRVIEAAISPRGDVIVGIDPEGTILEGTDPRAAEDRGWPSGHRRVDSIAVTMSGQVVTAGAEPLVRVVDHGGSEVDRLAGGATGEVAVAASPDGMHIAYVHSGSVWYWNRQQRREPVRLPDGQDAVTVAVTPDGRQIVVGGLGGGIWVWGTDGQPAQPLRMRGHGRAVRSFAVTPDCMQLISGAEDGTIRIWDLATGAEISPGTPSRPRPELASDQESAVDLLGFADDVDNLAALITDRGTRPPLAVALLGRWGSGKSSFMRQLQDSVARFAAQGRENPARSVFATAVRQVRFDAWHYNDDHLWVGMVEHLFAGLTEPAQADAEGAREERDVLRKRLQDLEEVADPAARAWRRLRARLRLWAGSLAPWRGRIVVAASAAVLLGAATGLTWWLGGQALVTTVLGFLTGVAASPLVRWIGTAWRSVHGLVVRHDQNLAREVRDTRMRLARLDAAQRLALVIDDARAGGFDQYRGLLGRVHADLRTLSHSAEQAFAEWDGSGSVGEPPLERVILYIDDLDRCSPRKVVDVLAAVHLLLALPLFVVVVAVDPRWLRRCLTQYHAELFGTDADTVGGATPLDYLDKIFQVVFSLRPMGNEANRLIEALVPAEVPGRPEPRTPEEGPARRRVDQNEPVRTGDTPETVRRLESEAVPQPEQLRLRAEEVAFIRRLRPLLDTPRSVKRFVNLYRLVRTSVGADELDEFLGTDGTGPYQAVLVLLAVLVFAPQECRALIETLRNREREETITAVTEELASADRAHDVWIRLRAVVHDGDPMEDTLSTYRGWAGTIARFSFETWDLTEPR